MASPKCGHCGATAFDSKTHIHEEVPTLYICCSGCGAVVGVVNKIKPQSWLNTIRAFEEAVEHNRTPATEPGLSFSSYAKGNKKMPSSNQKANANQTPEEMELWELEGLDEAGHFQPPKEAIESIRKEGYLPPEDEEV
jgi:hypothetical protein